LGIGERSDKDGIEHCKDGRGSAYTNAKGQDDGAGECGSAARPTNGVLRISQELLHVLSLLRLSECGAPGRRAEWQLDTVVAATYIAPFLLHGGTTPLARA